MIEMTEAETDEIGAIFSYDVRNFRNDMKHVYVVIGQLNDLRDLALFPSFDSGRRMIVYSLSDRSITTLCYKFESENG